jgi:hypothetical protein
MPPPARAAHAEQAAFARLGPPGTPGARADAQHRVRARRRPRQEPSLRDSPPWHMHSRPPSPDRYLWELVLRGQGGRRPGRQERSSLVEQFSEGLRAEFKKLKGQITKKP